MIIQCQGCAAKYFLPEEKVPENPLKVRCPKCQAVFTLVRNQEPVGASVAADARPTAPPAPAESTVPPLETVSAMDAVSAPPQAPAEAPAPEPEGKTKKKKGGRSKEDRAKRLARVLVSDILWYNREKRDGALEDGTLMTTLGEEIKKSWELYKEKIGPDLANSTNFFKEALNEILAEGQEVF